MKTFQRGFSSLFLPAATGFFLAASLVSCYTEQDFAAFSANSKALRGIRLEKYEKWKNETRAAGFPDNETFLSSDTEINIPAFTETLPHQMTSGVLHLSLLRSGANRSSLRDGIISGMAVYRELPSGKLTSTALPPVRFRLERINGSGSGCLRFASVKTNSSLPDPWETGSGKSFPLAGIRAILLTDDGKTLIVYVNFLLFRNNPPRKLNPPEFSCIFRKNDFLRFRWIPDTGKKHLPEPERSFILRAEFPLSSI